MKRILCGAAALLLALLLCGQALAAASAEPVRIFVYEDTLYTYMELEGVDSPITQVEAKIEGQSFPATSRLETVRQAGFPITYLLLVDNSNSMPPFREQLNAFGRGLAENSGENTRFILATFGDEFQVISDSVPAEELEAQLAAIPLDEPVTRLHTSMNSALDYLEAMPRQGTELRSMVVITDGVQYDPLGAVPYEELLERISHSDVMLHSLGMGSDSEALASLGRLTEASGGLHQSLADGLGGESAAKALSDAGGDLMVTGFDLAGRAAPGEDQEVSFTFASSGALVCRGEAVVDIPGDESAGDGAGQAESPAESSGENSEESLAESSGGNPEETASEPVESEPASESADASSAETSAGQSPEAAPESGQPTDASDSPQGNSQILIGGGIAAAAVIAVVIALLARGRKKGKKAAGAAGEQTAGDRTAGEQTARDPSAEGSSGDSEAAGAETASADSVYMRIDKGNNVALPGGSIFVLRDELFAGSGADCGIVLKDDAVAPRALRIFLENGFVRAEALDPGTPVQVNGEILAEVRTLRSGDRITVGKASFRPMF